MPASVLGAAGNGPVLTTVRAASRKGFRSHYAGGGTPVGLPCPTRPSATPSWKIRARRFAQGNPAYSRPSASASLARCLAFKHQSKIDLQRPPRTPSPGYSPKEWRQRTPVLTASMGMRRKEMVVPVELAHCMAEAGLARLPSIIAQMLMHKPRRNREPRACMLLVSVLHRRSL